MNQCWFNQTLGEASGEAALSGEARAEISRELDEPCFLENLTLGNPEVSQSKRDGKDLDSAGASGQDVLHGIFRRSSKGSVPRSMVLVEEAAVEELLLKA